MKLKLVACRGSDLSFSLMCPPGKRDRAHSKSPVSKRRKAESDDKYHGKQGPTDHHIRIENPLAMNLPELNRLGRCIGAHISAAGGLFHAFENTKRINGNAMALFLKSQRQWEAKPLEEETVVKFKETSKFYNFDMSKILPHGSYLVNLGNPDEGKRAKSYAAFVDELKRCEQLGIQLYNFHPGSTVGECTVKESIKFIAESINTAHAETSSVVIVIENMVMRIIPIFI